jgi:hypothetical protein
MTLCDHLSGKPWPLIVDLTIDEHLGFTDALTHCRACGRTYLLEMLDWRGSTRLFRVRSPSAAHAAQLTRDLDRGSCDIQRAQAEVSHLLTSNPFLDTLLALDLSVPVVRELIAVNPQTLPGASWRDLPCDGSWFAQLRVYTEMENE